MAYNTPETVADYLARFQMEITHRGKGTFTPDHVKYSLTIASGGKDFFTTFESNPHVHGEPTITQVFGALASDAMVVRDYGMDEFVDEFCDGMKPSAAIRAYNSCKRSFSTLYLRFEALLHPVTATATTDGKRVSVHVCSFPSRTAACNPYAA